MKSILLAGHKTKAYCHKCDEFRPAEYSYGEFPFDNGMVAENVLRATCDECHEIVALAHQSAPALKEALQKTKITTTMRFPQELLDFVGLQLDKAGGRINQYDLFIRALLIACKDKEKDFGRKIGPLKDPILERPNTTTINVALTSRLHQTLSLLVQESGIPNASEVVRRLIVLAEEPSLYKRVSAETEKLCLAF